MVKDESGNLRVKENIREKSGSISLDCSNIIII